MVHRIFQIAYRELDMNGFMKRYHFAQQDFEMAEAAARFLSEMTKVEIWLFEEEDGVVCAATLGRRYDDLAGLVAESGNLLLSYCMECLGMEFLSKAYEKINDTVHESKGFWLSKYHFLEEKDFLQRRDILCGTGVEWKNGMIRPLKSVVFHADYRTQKEDEGCHDCSNCENITCSFRKMIEHKNKLYENVDNRKRSAKAYSYGVTAIFGGGDS